MYIRRGALHDIPAIMEIIHDAKINLREQGSDQWQDDYPNIEVIEQDIYHKEAYIVLDEGVVCAYFCISFRGEDCYEQINGSWITSDDYAVVHRIAVKEGYTGKGISTMIFNKFEEICSKNSIPSIRIDTFEENKVMLNVLSKFSYTQCGSVSSDNCTRIAFEKCL